MSIILFFSQVTKSTHAIHHLVARIVAVKYRINRQFVPVTLNISVLHLIAVLNVFQVQNALRKKPVLIKNVFTHALEFAAYQLDARREITVPFVVVVLAKLVIHL